METTIKFLKDNWKFILITLLVIAGFIFCYGEYKDYKANQPIPQVIVQGLTEKELDAKLQQLVPNVSPGQRSEITREITNTITKEIPAQTTFTAKTQTEADKKANDVAKADKAEGIVKQTTETKDGTIQNNYWGIHTEKEHKIKVGATVGGYNSVDIGYQQKRLDITYHKSIDTQKNDAVSAMWTAIQW
jgi:hypothetical protein